MDLATHPATLLLSSAVLSYTFALPAWATAALAFALLNLKSLPLAYHIRLLPSLARLYLPRTTTTTKPPDLFHTHSARTRVTPLDCDVNLHKSNSTFLADMDASRAALLSALFAPALRALSASAVLGGVQASFLRPLMPFAAYEVRSRVVAWDDAKWVYVGTRFVAPGEGGGGTVFAEAVSRYVVKRGRRTVRPGELLGVGGFLGSGGEAEKERLEAARVEGLEGVRRMWFA